MHDNLRRYLPEYDDVAAREHLTHFSKEQLIEMLIRSYMEKRLAAKMLGERMTKLDRIKALIEEPSALLGMPDVPSSEEIRRMLGDEDPAGGE